MSAPEVVMFAVVLLTVFPAAWRNLTAFALAAAYLFVQGMWAVGVRLDAGILFGADMTVIAVIYGKAALRCPDVEIRSTWEQLKCFHANLTRYDRLIVALFLFGAWPAYVLNVPDLARWWALYAMALAQYVAAAAESFTEWRRAKAPRSDPDHPSSGSLRVALAGPRQWLT